jgi:hypothetical protein
LAQQKVPSLDYTLEQNVENMREELTTTALKDFFVGSAKSFKFEQPSRTECRKDERRTDNNRIQEFFFGSAKIPRFGLSLEQNVEKMREELTTTELKKYFSDSAKSFKFEGHSTTECRKDEGKAENNRTRIIFLALQTF